MKKYLIIATLVVGVFAAYWVAFGNPFKKSAPAPETPGTEPGTESIPAPPAAAQSPGTKDKKGFPLSVGSSG